MHEDTRYVKVACPRCIQATTVRPCSVPLPRCSIDTPRPLRSPPLSLSLSVSPFLSPFPSLSRPPFSLDAQTLVRRAKYGDDAGADDMDRAFARSIAAKRRFKVRGSQWW